MTTDPRALIAEGRAHDEAMTAGPWTDWPGMQGLPGFPRVLGDMKPAGREEIAKIGSWTRQRENAAGIAWLRTNLALLLDGYASALDEVDMARSILGASPSETLKHAAERVEVACAERARERDAARWADETRGRACKAALAQRDEARAEIVTLRTSLGEQVLVIEQQDRDLERMCAALREAAALSDVPEHAQDDEWSTRREAIDVILNQGAPCTTTK